MEQLEELLAALEAAARSNEKSEFDRLERELLRRFEGSFDTMPPEVYERYLDVDRHWPIVVAAAGSSGRTLEIRLPLREQLWLERLAAVTDRSLSSVIGGCLEAIRADSELKQRVRARLEQVRSPKAD